MSGLVSTGFCGALDPAIQPLDIFIPTEIIGPLDHTPTTDRPISQQNRDRQGASVHPITTNRPHQTGTLLSQDRVASTIAEKSDLRKTSASAIEMEAAAVAEKAQQYNLPFYCIRVVTDTANESFPLDFNKLRDADGRFSLTKILSAALQRPTVFPALMKLNKRTQGRRSGVGGLHCRHSLLRLSPRQPRCRPPCTRATVRFRWNPSLRPPSVRASCWSAWKAAGSVTPISKRSSTTCSRRHAFSGMRRREWSQPWALGVRGYRDRRSRHRLPSHSVSGMLLLPPQTVRAVPGL